MEECAKLNNGIKILLPEFGVFEVPVGEEGIQPVLRASEEGNCSLDAGIYHNEEGSGKALTHSGIPHEEIFVTTSMWNQNQGYPSTPNI